MSNLDNTHEAARSGDAERQFQLAVIYDNGDGVKRDPVAAANWYRHAAEQGHSLAQLHLGLMLNAGDTAFERNDAEAAGWFLQAAEQGLCDAQFNIGLMYYNAEGVEQNDPEAFRWFDAAARQGNPKAQFNLGVMYANGHGTPTNFVEAYTWWLLAIMQGDPNAHANIEMMREKLSAEESGHAQTVAAERFNEFQLPGS
jgi:TPR repeat protein